MLRIAAWVLLVVVLLGAIFVELTRRNGPTTSLPCAMLRAFCPKIQIHGRVSPGFEEVKEAFTTNFEEGLEFGAQFSVWLDNEHIVDLWASVPQTPAYSNSSLQRVFSSTKVLESVAVAIAADRGWLDYEAPVAKYWPEFKQHGKEHITVSEVMRHEGGLYEFQEPVTPEILQAYVDGDPAPLAELVARQKPIWPADTRRVYHALSRGFVIAEFLRRVDPKHRLIHEFITEEILQPLKIEWYLPLPDAKRNNVVPNRSAPSAWLWINVVIPFLLSQQSSLFPPLDGQLETVLRLAFDPSSPLSRTASCLSFGDGTPAPHNDPRTYPWVYTSASSFATGHGLAALANVMAHQGEAFGVKLLSRKGFKAATECGELMFDAALGINTSFTPMGTACHLAADVLPLNGWGGWGGSIINWDTKQKLGLGYAMNLMGLHLTHDPRVIQLLKALQRGLAKRRRRKS